ncbi:unnamed protein product, partial [Mesorhabditis spiculigera]
MAFLHPRVMSVDSDGDKNGLHVNGQDSLVQPLLTDFYQISMTYSYWKSKIQDEPAVFDLFFRKNPFHGEFTIFAGLEDCLRFVESFRFSESDISYIRTLLPHAEPSFFDYLEALDCSSLTIHAVKEGSLVFPKIPLLSVSGPLAICQLLETTLLNLVNYSSLVATNAARFRLAAGPKINLLEFGLRRAQGPNGGLAASKYCYIGGFDGTSNVLAGKLFGIPVKGTQAHSFISAFSQASDLRVRELTAKNGDTVDLYELAVKKRDIIMEKLSWGVSGSELSEGELCAFVAYAISFPQSFLALIDTYDVLRSGVVNFVAVCMALNECGYTPIGCRIDSGDLSYLSKEVRQRLKAVAALDESTLSFLSTMTIVASNDINEETILSLNEQKHEIDSFGVGTHLVTCQKQPALGCVYKLVTVGNAAKIKLSQEVAKISIPGRKMAYRVYGKAGYAILDILQLFDEAAPEVNKQMQCRHPFEESKRAMVLPSRVEPLHHVFWADGKIQQKLPTLQLVKEHVQKELEHLRNDHKRQLNPTPYKVSVSERLYIFLHDIWLKNAPIGQLD